MQAKLMPVPHLDLGGEAFFQRASVPLEMSDRGWMVQ